ncbi:MAG: restriction endonuclease subunit S [Balneola sp.]|nr:restriction endonuclease subunit S [Balneola sp.]
MNKELKLVIPELRFDEPTGHWAITRVSKICDVYRGSTFSKSDINEDGTELCIHYGELFTKYSEIILDIYSRTDKKDGFRSESGDILMPSSDVTPDGLAKASAITLDDVLLGGDMNILRPKLRVNSIFLSYLLNHSKREIIKLVSGTTVKHIYPKQIITCQIPIVDNESQQQKIADCLSSLDKLIVAHNKKLEALKDHKKGLLQNLFPQEGETVPKVRFPEFEKDGEWVEKKLGEVGDPKMCKRIFKNQTTPNPEGGIPFYKIGTFGKEADAYIPDDLYNDYKENYNFPDKGDILISASGTIGRLVIYNGEPAYFQDSNIVWLEHDHSEVKNDFLYYCYSNIKWQTSDGGVIKRLYNTDLKNISIKFPKSEDEQIKISNCVATIDAIINEQVEKIDELRHHKKGLMQGLFPNLK